MNGFYVGICTVIMNASLYHPVEVSDECTVLFFEADDVVSA